MKQKLQSRKFWAMIVGVIFTMAATLGYNIPIGEVAAVDAMLGLYMIVEGIVDVRRG